MFVDDVDKHFRQAKKSGAKIFEEPQDQFYGDHAYKILIKLCTVLDDN